MDWLNTTRYALHDKFVSPAFSYQIGLLMLNVMPLQCPSGTRACLTKVNHKENEPDRVTAVIPIAQSNNLDLNYSLSQGLPFFFFLRYIWGVQSAQIQMLQSRKHCRSNCMEPPIPTRQYGSFWTLPYSAIQTRPPNQISSPMMERD